MNVPLLVRSGQSYADAGLAKAVIDHVCVSLVGKAGAGMAALLIQTERELSSHCVRCIRVYGPSSGGLALRDLIAQVVGRPDSALLTDHDLKAGFVALTEPGGNYDLVALLVTEAHSLLPSAMRYIQLACRSSPKLRVVLAGQPSLAATLAQDEFAYLRRITQELELHDMVGEGPSGGGLAVPEPLPVPHRSGPSALVRLGLAALLVPMVGLIWWRHLPASPVVDMLGVPSPSAHIAQPVLAEPATTEQEPAEEVSPPELEAELNPEPAAAAVDVPPPVSADIPVEPASALPGATVEARIPELPAEPVKPAESSATVGDEPPAAAMPERTTELIQEAVEPAKAAPPAQEAGPTSVQVPEPAVQAQDAAPASPETADVVSPAVGASMPVPPLPRPGRSAAPALPPPASPAVQHARTEAPRAAATAAVPPTRLTDDRRCRDIVLKAQLGKDLSDADKRFLRSGCRAE